VYASSVKWRSLFILWVLAAVHLVWWVDLNPLPDGYQNEYILLGNAMDLWGAFTDGDTWHMRWYMYTGYWPWGLYAAPWPIVAALGPTRLAFVMGNLIHLAVLLVAVNHLGRSLGGRLAPVLILLCPGVFGTLVRFEPNLAAIAWTAVGLAALVHSQGLERKRPVWLFGAALGTGLMMDRLTVAFFLLPALLPLLPRITRTGLKHLAQAAAIALVMTAAYYREFFNRHTSELTSQAGTGEIDSTGVITEVPALLEWAYYPLAMIDSQAGPILGLVFAVGLIGAASRSRSILLASVIGGVGFFTLISKNQVFYTLPILAPLAAMAAARPRLAWLGIAGGLWGYLALGVGVAPGGPWLPEAWVSPRHTLARPPAPIETDLEPALSALAGSDGSAPQHVSVLSHDHRLFEGFLLLAVRERWPDTPARGVVMDPHGTFEMFHEMDAFLWVAPRGSDWPSAAQIRSEMQADHIDPDSMPPAPRVVEAQRSSFDEHGRWALGDSRDIIVYRRR
jgi:hypothetical protein